MKRVFLNHPHHAGETFWVHFKFAAWDGVRMMAAGVVCIVHACLPFVFEHTASNIIIPLANELSSRVDIIKSSKKRKKHGKK